VDDPKQQGECPPKVEGGDAFSARMLHETSKPAEQRSDTEADDDRDHDPDVKIKVGIGKGSGHYGVQQSRQ